MLERHAERAIGRRNWMLGQMLENGYIDATPACRRGRRAAGRAAVVITKTDGAAEMRWGIEQSRNLMTVQAANRTGMEKVVDLMQRIGVSPQKYLPYLAYALGASETTVMRMVNAYSILGHHGRALNPSLIDFVQDPHGKVIWPENWRACDRCNAPDWDGKAMPRPVVRSRQVLDAMSA